MDYSEADQKLANEMLNAGVKDGADEILGIDTSTMDPKTVRKLLVKKGILKKAMGGEIKKMKDGGDVPMPKRRPKKDQFRADKTESLDKEFSKKVAKQNEKNMKNVKKMKDGGLTGNQFKLDKNKNGRIDGGDFAKMEVGGEALVTPIMKGKRISEKRKKLLLRREKEEMKKDIPVKKMEMGGKVEEYGGGGKVKGGKMTCRGMGAAVKGGGFSIS